MTVKKLMVYLENMPEDAQVLATDPENVEDWNCITSCILDEDGDVILV